MNIVAPEYYSHIGIFINNKNLTLLLSLNKLTIIIRNHDYIKYTGKCFVKNYEGNELFWNNHIKRYKISQLDNINEYLQNVIFLQSIIYNICKNDNTYIVEESNIMINRLYEESLQKYKIPNITILELPENFRFDENFVIPKTVKYMKINYSLFHNFINKYNEINIPNSLKTIKITGNYYYENLICKYTDHDKVNKCDKFQKNICIMDGKLPKQIKKLIVPDFVFLSNKYDNFIIKNNINYTHGFSNLYTEIEKLEILESGNYRFDQITKIFVSLELFIANNPSIKTIELSHSFETGFIPSALKHIVVKYPHIKYIDKFNVICNFL